MIHNWTGTLPPMCGCGRKFGTELGMNAHIRNHGVDRYIHGELAQELAEALAHVPMRPNWEEYGAALARYIATMGPERFLHGSVSTGDSPATGNGGEGAGSTPDRPIISIRLHKTDPRTGAGRRVMEYVKDDIPWDAPIWLRHIREIEDEAAADERNRVLNEVEGHDSWISNEVRGRLEDEDEEPHFPGPTPEEDASVARYVAETERDDQ